MVEFKKDYFVSASKDFNESVANYYDKTPYNYVIIEDGRPIVWASNQCPIIFGSIQDALYELECWATPIRNVSIINEREFIDEWCKDELTKALDDEKPKGIMWSISHDAELVRQINNAWDKNKRGFKEILCALYARDIEEITDADSFQIDRWRPDQADGCTDEIVKAFNDGIRAGDWERYNELALKDMVREWDMFANNYLEHIADDCDLECILNFLHYPHLPIYSE